jgi:hypothetical protein
LKAGVARAEAEPWDVRDGPRKGRGEGVGPSRGQYRAGRHRSATAERACHRQTLLAYRHRTRRLRSTAANSAAPRDGRRGRGVTQLPRCQSALRQRARADTVPRADRVRHATNGNCSPIFAGLYGARATWHSKRAGTEPAAFSYRIWGKRDDRTQWVIKYEWCRNVEECWAQDSCPKIAKAIRISIHGRTCFTELR